MSNVLNFPNQERRFDEASLWIARIDRGLTDDEQQQLASWLNEDSGNVQILLELAALWDKMDRLSLLSEVFQVQPKQSSLNWFKYAAASFFLILCAGLFFSFGMFSPDAGYSTEIYKTAIGEQRRVILQDGSTLILNTNSELDAHFSSEQRLLVLKSGEMHIKVKHDTSRPLRVLAQDKLVQAVGTAFDVRILDNKEVKLWVTEGRVLVADGTKVSDPAQVKKLQLPKNSLSVSKGEQVVLSDASAQVEVEKVSDVDVGTQLGWHQGNIVFRGETLDEAIAEFNRYTNTTFVIGDESLKSIRIAGVFKISDSTSTLLSTLKNNFSIDYKYTSDNQILLVADSQNSREM